MRDTCRWNGELGDMWESMPCSSFMPRPVKMKEFFGDGGGGRVQVEVWGQD